MTKHSNRKQKSPATNTPAAAAPAPARPYMPGYGIPKSLKGTLPWSHVTERLEKAVNYKMRHPPPFWTIRPRVVFAWSAYLKDATRWVVSGK